MSYRMPVSQSELDAMSYLAREFPGKFYLEQMHYLDGMCIHWKLWEKAKRGTLALSDEVIAVYFGKPAMQITETC